MSKAKILHNISHALKRNALPVEKGNYFDVMIPLEEGKIAEYKRAQMANKAEVFEIEEAQIPEILHKIIQKEEIKSVILPKDLTHLPLETKRVIYDQSMEMLKEELFNTDCALLRADFGVSNLGIVCAISSPTQPRLLSLITRCCVILLKKEQIVGNMTEVFKALKSNGVLPSNIIFIAGPSRTADIELQVVFGVHGPQSVYILLY